jgi:hypothetical protein
LSELLDLAEKRPCSLPYHFGKDDGEGQQASSEFNAGKKEIFLNVLPLLIHPEINIRLGAWVAEMVGRQVRSHHGNSIKSLARICRQ